MGGFMSSVILTGDTSGTLTIAAPAIAGSNTATLPAATGTVMVSGNMPAFAAYASNGQSCASAAATKITFGTTRYDTNSNFSSSRFTPTVAGYYQISAAVTLNANVNNVGILGCIYKNGSSYACGSAVGTGAQYPTATVSALIYMNGSTDYVEIYVFNSGGSAYTVVGGVLVTADSTWFTGALVRAA